MSDLILLLHMVSCFGIIALVLLQQGKGADVGATFGSGSANTFFGSRGPASFLFKLTGAFALLFFITSLSLTYFQAQEIKAANTLLMPAATGSAPPFLPPASGVSS